MNAVLKRRDFLENVEYVFRNNASLCRDIKKVCEYVALHMSARSYYVSAKHALSEYYRYLKTGSLAHLSSERREMFSSIFSRYRAKLDSIGNSRSHIDIMGDVVLECAPSFYIKPESAIFYYYRAIKQSKR